MPGGSQCIKDELSDNENECQSAGKCDCQSVEEEDVPMPQLMYPPEPENSKGYGHELTLHFTPGKDASIAPAMLSTTLT